MRSFYSLEDQPASQPANRSVNVSLSSSAIRGWYFDRPGAACKGGFAAACWSGSGKQLEEVIQTPETLVKKVTVIGVSSD